MLARLQSREPKRFRGKFVGLKSSERIDNHAIDAPRRRGPRIRQHMACGRAQALSRIARLLKGFERFLQRCGPLGPRWSVFFLGEVPTKPDPKFAELGDKALNR